MKIDSEQIEQIEGLFKTYDISLVWFAASIGPAIIRYEFKPKGKDDIERYISMKEDILYAIKSILPYPTIYLSPCDLYGEIIVVELAKKQASYVELTDCVDHLSKDRDCIPIIIGEDVGNKVIIKDLKELKNIVVSGATGTGKSVFLNSVINTILLTKTPQEVQLMLVDIKQVEFYIYENIPHLKYPVLFDVEQSALTMSNLLQERERKKNDGESYPDIVILLEDYADFIGIEHNKDLTDQILKILTDGYKYGIYMILSSSKISDNELLKSIRESIPVKLTGALASAQDSMRMLGEEGAENLIGNGDMIFKDINENERVRVQTPFIATREIEEITKKLKTV